MDPNSRPNDKIDQMVSVRCHDDFILYPFPYRRLSWPITTKIEIMKIFYTMQNIPNSRVLVVQIVLCEGANLNILSKYRLTI